MKSALPVLLLAGAALAFAPGPVNAQPTFSIDWQGPTKSMPDFFWGVPITEGDILMPGLGAPAFGPLPPPGLVISGGFGPPAAGLMLPAHPGAIGLPPGVPGRVEVDALSYGTDDLVGENTTPNWYFSVDEFAASFPGLPGGVPDVFSEGALGAMEASADVFTDLGLMPGPIPPFATPVPGNTAVYDGDGLMSTSGAVYPGLGLIEPNLPGPGLPDSGDNLDALDMDSMIPQDPGVPLPVYFSLDSPFFDPVEGMPNTSSAAVNGGFSGGDVLVTITGVVGPAVYAPAPMLGLDLVAGHDTDDLDALILHENGDGVFTPPQSMFDWVFGNSDMIFFSVRRGSALIGAPDSIFGIPIEEGDILMPPLPGGVSPFPGIFIAAENLGLATLRSGVALQPWADDLNALDVVIPQPGTLALLGLGGLLIRRRR